MSVEIEKNHNFDSDRVQTLAREALGLACHVTVVDSGEDDGPVRITRQFGSYVVTVSASLAGIEGLDEADLLLKIALFQLFEDAAGDRSIIEKIEGFYSNDAPQAYAFAFQWISKLSLLLVQKSPLDLALNKSRGYLLKILSGVTPLPLHLQLLLALWSNGSNLNVYAPIVQEIYGEMVDAEALKNMASARLRFFDKTQLIMGTVWPQFQYLFDQDVEISTKMKKLRLSVNCRVFKETPSVFNECDNFVNDDGLCAVIDSVCNSIFDNASGMEGDDHSSNAVHDPNQPPPDSSGFEAGPRSIDLVIQPKLKELYAMDRRCTLDTGGLMWSYTPKYGVAVNSSVVKSHSMTGRYSGSGVMFIPIPAGYVFDVNSLKITRGNQPDVLVDQNGNFFLSLDGDCDFEIGFGKINLPDTIAPTLENNAKLMNQTWPTVISNEFFDMVKSSSPSEKASACKDYIQSRYVYPPGNSSDAFNAQSALRQSSGGNVSTYVYNLCSAEYLDCTSANTLAAAILRELDIPTRQVHGFMVSEANISFSADGHQWLEYWDGDIWCSLDCTPAKAEQDGDGGEQDGDGGEQDGDGGEQDGDGGEQDGDCDSNFSNDRCSNPSGLPQDAMTLDEIASMYDKLNTPGGAVGLPFGDDHKSSPNVEDEKSLEERLVIEAIERNLPPDMTPDEKESYRNLLSQFLKALEAAKKIPNPGTIVGYEKEPTLIGVLIAILSNIKQRAVVEVPEVTFRVPRGPILMDPVGLHLARASGIAEPAVFKRLETTEVLEPKIVKIRRRKVLDGSGSMDDSLYGQFGFKSLAELQQLLELLDNAAVEQFNSELNDLVGTVDRDVLIETESWQFGVTDQQGLDFRRIKPLSSKLDIFDQSIAWVLAGQVSGRTNDDDPLRAILEDLRAENTESLGSGGPSVFQRIRAGFLIREIKFFDDTVELCSGDSLNSADITHLHNLRARSADGQTVADKFRAELESILSDYPEIDPILEIIEVTSDGGSGDPVAVRNIVHELRSLGVIVIGFGLGAYASRMSDGYANAFDPRLGAVFCKNVWDYPGNKAACWQNLLDKI